MFKRFSVMLLLLAMVLQLMPALPAQTAHAAATGYFTFPKESTKWNEPRTTTNGRITIDGSISNIDASSISYSVVQVINTQGTEDIRDDLNGQKSENIKGGLYVSGYNLTANNVSLFTGLNRITFKGMQGGAEVSTSIYVNYHDGPVFYNLAARLDGSSFPMKENGTTVVQSTGSRGRQTTDIAITGNAPNAEKVTIEVNGASRSYTVSSANNYEFTISPLTVRKGKNLATIKVTNNNQTIETTREIAFYNGDVTFYDVNLNEDTQSSALEFSPNFSTSSATTPSKMKVTGTLIVPNNKKIVDGKTVPDPNPITDQLRVYPTLDGVKVPVNGIIATPTATVDTYSPDDDYYTYTFELPLDQMKASYVYDQAYSLSLEAINKIAGFSQGVYNLKFTLRDSTAPYISEINYIPGYKGPADLNISSKTLEGTNLYDTPLAVELLIGNYSDSNKPTVSGIKDINNKSANAADYIVSEVPNSKSTVTKTVNGVNKSFTRIVLQFDKLPFEGTQTVLFNLGAKSAGTVTFNMLFGPFLKYTSIYDSLKISYDTTAPLALDTIISNDLKNFEATLSNLNDQSDIRYTADAVKGPQTMFLYLNNTPIEIKAVDTNKPATFVATTNGIAKAKEIMEPGGAFNLRFVYKGSKNNYENSITILLEQKNLPVIPALPDSIYPYTNDLVAPLPNDPAFPKQGSVFNTKEPYMSIHGTFDFLDLGYTFDEVKNKIDGFISGNKASNYILKIEGSNMGDPIKWTLNNELRIVDDISKPKDKQTVDLANSTKTIPPIPSQGDRTPKLIVSFDMKSQTFSWELTNQYLSKDGTSSVYNFYVYNNGEAGARAGYRLEVDPTALPYKILRPLSSKRIVNQNYVEVVIDAPNAKTVTVNKQAAEKVSFDADNDGTVDYTSAYRVMISGLKAGSNKLTFVIANDNDTTTDYINVTYAPTNIPGAGFMETMKSSHKVFEGELQLTFPKSTTLIRRDYNVPQKLKNQVYTGNRLLFGIANPTDGVLDRHEFEQWPVNFDNILKSMGNMFNTYFSNNFNKAGKVFWVDAGLADNPQTDSAYDPLSYGIDPYQFPTATVPSYLDRPIDRELVTSKEAKLTLSYDPNIVEANGTFITVFHFDPKVPAWVNIGGIVDTKKHTVTVPFTEFGYYVVGQLKYSFLDITSHPYARNYMEAMYAKGFINAVSSQEFGANLYTSRGEFATMVVKAMATRLNYNYATGADDRLFSDVGTSSSALWDYRYVETAFNEGYIRGTSPKIFEPDKNLSREDAAVILARAMKLKLETDPAKIEKALQKSFKDYAQIDYYARASVLAIYQKGYIQGSPVDSSDLKKGSVFEPKANLLRSDSSIILGKVLVSLKRLPKIN